MAKRVTMAISIPAPMRAWVDRTVSNAGYGTASEYIRSLVREDHQRRLKTAIDSELIASVESGPPRRVAASEWESLRDRLQSPRERRRTRRAG